MADKNFIRLLNKIHTLKPSDKKEKLLIKALVISEIGELGISKHLIDDIVENRIQIKDPTYKRISYCYFCDKEIEYKIKYKEVSLQVDNKTVSYIAKIPQCSECGNEMDIPEIDDENIKIVHKKLISK